MTNFSDEAMTIKLDYELPEYPVMEACYRRAPRRESHLSEADKALAIKNALRYIHPDHHAQMAMEFAQELKEMNASFFAQVFEVDINAVRAAGSHRADQILYKVEP